jgi:hypothetical protein
MAMNASLENVLNINTTHWRISDALEIVQASSSPIEVRRKVGSVLHLYYSLGWTAHDLRMAMTNAVRVPSGGRNQIGRLTAVRRGRGGRPWRMAMEDGHGGRPWWTRRWKILKKRPSICFSTSYPLWHASRNLSLNSRINVLISGAQGH